MKFERKIKMTETKTLGTITMENGEVIHIEFFPNEAPNTVANFKELADKEFYNGLTFFIVLTLGLIPAVILGVKQKSLKKYTAFLSLIMIYLIYRENPKELVYLFLYVFLLSILIIILSNNLLILVDLLIIISHINSDSGLIF